MQPGWCSVSFQYSIMPTGVPPAGYKDGAFFPRQGAGTWVMIMLLLPGSLPVACGADYSTASGNRKSTVPTHG